MRGQPEEEERGPPERQRTLNACSHQGGGGVHSVVRASRAQPGDGGGQPAQAAGSPESSEGTEEGGAPTNQQRAFLTHDLREREREGGTPPGKEG